ncbi:ribonuclease HIII [Oceanobacillus chungangensis]|uniref:Ribonuclease HIII n=1 Tax=Oceanobacillus chungangensis TaxID=1229152 RepID=A0A3D8PZK5_9BACI|nr:ribonuclease HIII [Oceanobacillus chungangensis]RDW21620.1 ribonuclease HIII [Oceanobacillus chungangensis]
MAQQVHIYSIETINKMKHYYTDSLTTTPQGAIFRAKTPQAVITAYKSGKVLFQGNAPEAEAARWGEGNPTPEKKKPQAKVSSYTPPATLFTSNHIGSDEAGTGDYFGPITVAAAYVEKQHIPLLKELGVKDSKALTDPIIRKLSKEIIKLKIPYSLLVLHNEKYNKLQKRGWSQGKMKAMLHHHAITNLTKKIGNAPLDGILVDQFCEPNIYTRHIATENQRLQDKTYFMTKAESYSIAVATGSIIARTSFLNEMDKLSEQIGIELPKGASQKVDRAIAAVMREKGEEALNICAKTHFANTIKARKYL